MTFSRAAICLALAGSALGLPLVARAQDSVSTSNGLPGDAPNAYQVTSGDTRQVLRYVVDLTSKSSSWAGQYALAPVVKASASSAGGYFDQLMGAQCASTRFGSGLFASTQQYFLWTAAPGAGVNPPANSAPPLAVSGAGRYGQRFGLGFMEYGAGSDGVFGSGDDENTLVGSLVDFQYRRPNRLYVQRVVAANNKTVVSNSGTASFGLGAVDELGNLHAYADGYAMTISTRLQTRALIRLKLNARNPASANQIAGSGSVVIPGDAPAVDTVRTGVVMDTVPNIISGGLPGGAGRPVLLSSDLTNNYVFESAANTSSVTTSYLSASATSPRGSICFVPQVYSPVAAASPVGTAATLARTDSNTKTRAVQVFGVGSSGAIGTSTTVTLPASAASLVDAQDGFSPGASFSPITDHEFTHYAGQASFRGGASQVAMMRLPSGDLLVAATVAATGGGSTIPQSENNYIAVARLPAAGGTPTWTIAAHTGASGFAGSGAGVASKTIFGRSSPTAALAPIGRLAKYTEVYGSAATGPSISAPAFDLGGNVYFMATIGLTGTSGTTFTTGLLRANFNGASNAYQLELITAVGDVLPGVNSGKNYQIQYLGVADADSVDSGSIFSASTVQDSIAGSSAAAAPYGSPMSLGAIVFRAKIVYDINADTLFADPSGPGSGSTSPDQAYNVQMVLMPRVAVGDFNRDQTISVQDIFDFLAVWFASGTGSDWNGDGATTVQDIFDFLADWFAGG
jgi:hypothetical protein